MIASSLALRAGLSMSLSDHMSILQCRRSSLQLSLCTRGSDTSTRCCLCVEGGLSLERAHVSLICSHHGGIGSAWSALLNAANSSEASIYGCQRCLFRRIQGARQTIPALCGGARRTADKATHVNGDGYYSRGLDTGFKVPRRHSLQSTISRRFPFLFPLLVSPRSFSISSL